MTKLSRVTCPFCKAKVKTKFVDNHRQVCKERARFQEAAKPVPQQQARAAAQLDYWKHNRRAATA